MSSSSKKPPVRTRSLELSTKHPTYPVYSYTLMAKRSPQTSLLFPEQSMLHVASPSLSGSSDADPQKHSVPYWVPKYANPPHKVAQDFVAWYYQRNVQQRNRAMDEVIVIMLFIQKLPFEKESFWCRPAPRENGVLHDLCRRRYFQALSYQFMSPAPRICI